MQTHGKQSQIQIQTQSFLGESNLGNNQPCPLDLTRHYIFWDILSMSPSQILIVITISHENVSTLGKFTEHLHIVNVVMVVWIFNNLWINTWIPTLTPPKVFKIVTKFITAPWLGHLTKHTKECHLGNLHWVKNSEPGEFLKSGKKIKNCCSQSFPKFLNLIKLIPKKRGMITQYTIGSL